MDGVSKPPFFFAHGDLANGGLYCQRMARELGPDQPLYAIAPHGTFGGDLPSTFEEIAADYLELIRSVQPKGPYHLGGYCNGAMAMYEAAQQLIRAGETVSVLVLLDPPDLYFFLLRQRITRWGKLIGLSDRQGRNTYQRISEGMDIWQNHGSLRLLSEFWTRSMSWTLKTLKPLWESQNTAATSSKPNLNFHYYEVIASYEPQVYLGSKSAWIILRRGNSRLYTRQISCWSRFVPDAHFNSISGNYVELKSSMGEIAEIIKTSLTKPSLKK